MPSKRMVPEQESAELSDEIVRLRAEIGSVDYHALAEHALAEHQPGVEHSREQWIAGAYLRAKAEIAALTEQRDRAMRVLREPTQRMTEAALAAAGSDDDRSLTQIAYDILHAVLNAAAIDAEAAAEKGT